jgi:hypothetical protein
MTRIFTALAVFGTLVMLSLPATAGAANRPDGIRNAEQTNVSAARRHYRRYYRHHRRYVRPYYGGPYYGYGYGYYPRPYYRPYYYRPAPLPFFPFMPWW